MNLRPYQQECIDKALSCDARRICIVAPTGAGKTVIGATIANHFGGNVLWISHTEELDRQAKAVLPNNTITTTIQKILARDHYPDVSAVIIDECHHYVAEYWSSVIGQYPEARIFGLTATPQRGDGVALGNAFDQLIVAANYSDLLSGGFIVPCEVYSGTRKDLDPVDAYKRYVPGQLAFVYVSTVEDGETVAKNFNEHGIPAAFIGANTDKAIRKHIISRFNNEEIKVLVNVYTLTEGVDVPKASACIIARNVSHVGTYLQIAGRVLRPYPGKKCATIVDLPGVFRSFGPPTMDREYSLSGEGIGAANISVTTCKQCGRAYETGPKRCPGCDYLSPPLPAPFKLLWSEELQKVFNGIDTPTEEKHKEFIRLNEMRKKLGKSISWLIYQYKIIFCEVGDKPPLFLLSRDDRMEDYQDLLIRAKERGYQPGWAANIFKSRYGSWPRK